MNRTGIVALFILAGAGLALSCSRPVYRYEYTPYYPVYDIPRKVYVEDHVNPLYTDGAIPESSMTFVEVRTREGRRERGKLLQITMENLIMSDGYRYADPDDATSIIENEIIIPKSDILILKVW